MKHSPLSTDHSPLINKFEQLLYLIIAISILNFIRCNNHLNVGLEENDIECNSLIGPGQPDCENYVENWVTDVTDQKCSIILLDSVNNEICCCLDIRYFGENELEFLNCLYKYDIPGALFVDVYLIVNYTEYGITTEIYNQVFDHRVGDHTPSRCSSYLSDGTLYDVIWPYNFCREVVITVDGYIRYKCSEEESWNNCNSIHFVFHRTTGPNCQ